MGHDKVRIRFRKSGDIRLVSHLDLMRSFERLLRRASLPFKSTEGFHPSPRLSLAQSLSLGIVGHAEVAELELLEEIEPDEVLRRLREQAPPGVDFLSSVRIPMKSTARPRRGTYRLSGFPPADDLAERCSALMAATELFVDRQKPKPRSLDIRPYLDSVTVDGDAVQAVIWIMPDGSARADEVAKLLGLPKDLLIERTHLELHDEIDPETSAATPKIEPRSRPLNHPPLNEPLTVPRETWGATANGPVVE